MFSLFPFGGVLYTCIFLFCEFSEYSYSFPVDGKLDIRHLIDPLEHFDSLDDSEDDNNKKIVTKSVFNVPVRYTPEAHIHSVPKCPPGMQRPSNDNESKSGGPCVPMAPKITFGDSFLLQSFQAFLFQHKRRPGSMSGSGEAHGNGNRRRRPGTRTTTTTTESTTTLMTTTTPTPTTTVIDDSEITTVIPTTTSIPITFPDIVDDSEISMVITTPSSIPTTVLPSFVDDRESSTDEPESWVETTIEYI